MRPTVAKFISVSASVALMWAYSLAPAAAHEVRRVKGVELVVGWVEEPAYAGVPNQVELHVSDAQGDPVSAARDMQVEVGYADATVGLALQPAAPGEYRALIEPTRPGEYSFRITGRVGPKRIDERFVSGPKTFSSVQDPSALQFPSADPTTAQVAARLERESARLRERIDALSSEGREDPVDAVALAGLAVAAVALVGVALLARRTSTVAR